MDAAKRAMDVGGVLLALPLALPVMALIALWVRVDSPGPALFRQQRVGRGGRLFCMLKFRTMRAQAQGPQITATGDARITRAGRWLRASKLDELPQLINVLRGEMSIVGPRPIVQAERARYGRHFSAYCAVTPGITGVWQVCGRNDVSYRRRVACDVLYARSRSLPLNVRIIAMTIPAVLKSEGSY